MPCCCCFSASVFRPADCTPGITVKAHPDKSPARTLLASRRSLFPPSLNSGVGLMTRPSSTRSRYERRGDVFRKMAGALGSVSPARASGKGGDPARALAGFAAGLRTSNQISGRHMTHCGFTLGASYCSFHCTHCYLPKNANQVPLPSLVQMKEQIAANRRFQGPGGGLQITGGDVVDAYWGSGRQDRARRNHPLCLRRRACADAYDAWPDAP